MSLVSYGQLEMFGITNNADSTYTGKSMSASADKVAFVLQVPKTGNISTIGFRIGTLTTSDTLKISIQTVDGSGNPSGTLYGGSGSVTQASLVANTWFNVTLGTAAAAVQGDFIAVVIEFNSRVSGNLNISSNGTGGKIPYTVVFSSATWTKSTNIPILSIGYDDGSYGFCQCQPATALTVTSFNTGSTPDERALRFSMPVAARVNGIVLWSSSPSGADYDVVFYDTDGTTALQTVSVVANQMGDTAIARNELMFPSPVIIAASSFYRISVRPSTATNMSVHQYDLNSAAQFGGYAGGQNCHLSTRTDAGSWTDTTTSRPRMSLLFNQLDDGSGTDSFVRTQTNA